jgi:type III secretion protein C
VDLDYEDVGVRLEVRPIIGPNNVVTLEIEEEISDIIESNLTINNTVIFAPTTNKTSTKTRVHVPDGCFLVMSGHVQDKVVYKKNGIPCLGSLPWVGSLFSRTQDERTKRNLIMFIRPHVISDMEDSVWISNQEGYHFNYEARPESLKQTSRDLAPECQNLKN